LIGSVVPAFSQWQPLVRDIITHTSHISFQASMKYLLLPFDHPPVVDGSLMTTEPKPRSRSWNFNRTNW